MATHTFTDTPKIGVNLADVIKADDVGKRPAHRLGSQIWAVDGKEYVFGKASAAISASTSACDIDTDDFTVAATGGSYTSPAVAMATGDLGWFSKASV